MRTSARRGVHALACVVVVATVLVGQLPGLAAQSPLARDVAAARTVWKEAEQAREAAAALVADVGEALAEAEDDAEVAADVLDTATAVLVRRERAHEAAEQALRDAEAAAAASLAALHQRVSRYDADLSAQLDRKDAHAHAAVTALIQGDPQVRALSTLVTALDSSASAGDFLSATERLQWVTEDTRGRLDAADDALAGASDDVGAAARVLVSTRLVEEEAAEQREAAAEALAAQAARRDAAQVAFDEAVERVEELTESLAEAADELDRADGAAAALRVAMGRFGWRAGVPGPAGLVWPVDGAPGSGFGPRMHPIHGDVRPHLGTDVAAPVGRPVVAAADGRVIVAGDRGSYGLTVVLDHGEGRTTLYAHLSSIAVRVGAAVDEADLVGAVGSTGQSTGPHLHFEVRERGSPRDPLTYFR